MKTEFKFVVGGDNDKFGANPLMH